MNDPSHAFIQQLLRDRAAIVLDDNKGYLIDSRLLPVCKAAGLNGVGALVARLRRAPGDPLIQDVVEALTTNETSFYRDGTYYEALEQSVLPELAERRARQRSLSIWSAAASTGQEPYSLAMMLADMPAFEGWKLQIYATDIDEKVLAKARSGEFSKYEVNRGLPARKLVTHFEKVGSAFRIKPHIQKMVRFEQMNLARPWPRMPSFDLILIRNVLIYFDADTKRDILGRARRRLNPGGYLLLGGAETTINLTDEYDRVRVGRAVMYRSAA